MWRGEDVGGRGYLREHKEAASLTETRNNKNSSKKGLDRSTETCNFLWPRESSKKLPKAALISYLGSERSLWARKPVVENKEDTEYPAMGMLGSKANGQRPVRARLSSAVPKNHHRPAGPSPPTTLCCGDPHHILNTPTGERREGRTLTWQSLNLKKLRNY